VQKRDPLSLRSHAGLVVDELHPRRPAPRQHRVEVVDREADVMNPGTPFGDEARDWGIGVIGFQELHQGLPRAEPDYARAVGVVQGDLRQPQHIPEERQALGEGLNRDSDVGYARSTRG
jgi:hypothetical protein